MRNNLVWALLATATLAGPAHVHAADRTLKMVPIDLEGDGGTLYVTPEGRTVLVDAGSPVELSGGVKNGLDGAKDGVDRIIATAKSLGVKKIDYLLITHYHADHVGGVRSYWRVFRSEPSSTMARTVRSFRTRPVVTRGRFLPP